MLYGGLVCGMVYSMYKFGLGPGVAFSVDSALYA